jgi:hypothetical protein
MVAVQIMLNVPFAFLGSVAALAITREPFSVASLVGFISLTGIATRNGVLMVSHYIHLMTEERRPWSKELIIQGSQERVAPVLMTAVTAGLGLIPLVLSKGEPGKEILYPVAVVILGGSSPARCWTFRDSGGVLPLRQDRRRTPRAREHAEKHGEHASGQHVAAHDREPFQTHRRHTSRGERSWKRVRLCITRTRPPCGLRSRSSVMNRLRLPVLSLILASGLALSTASMALAQHSHGDDKPGGEGSPATRTTATRTAKSPRPRSFADAVQRIAADVKAMDAALAGGSIAGVSDKANSVATLAKTMGALAARQGERRAREKVKEINLASKELAEAADNLHNIADAGDVAKSKAAFAPVKAAAAKVAALAPAMAEGHDHAHGAEAVAVTHTVTVAAEGSKAIEAGKAVPMVFTLKDAKGAPVKDLDTVHEKVLHLLAVSKDPRGSRTSIPRGGLMARSRCR